jgi:hypothetical protein
MSEPQSQALVPLSKSLETLEAEIGGRGQIIQALATAPQSKQLKYVLGVIADPDNCRLSLAQICLLAKVLPGTLLEMLEQGTKLRARIIAGQIIAQHTPHVVRDVMRKAAPYEDVCSDCQGAGARTADPTAEEPNPSPKPCQTCRGGGRLLYEHNEKDRDRALEMAGLVSSGSGIQINNTNTNLQVAPQSGSAAFEALQELMDKSLYGRREPVIDADVRDVSPDTPT